MSAGVYSFHEGLDFSAPVARTPQVNLVPPPSYNLFTQRESDGIKVVGGARVIFKEERVAPLFVAQPVDSERTYSRSATGNHKDTGSEAQDCPEYTLQCYPTLGI